MRKFSITHKVPAFSLQEMLVVMGIAAILFLVAMPMVEPLFNKARSMEAKAHLGHVFTLEKTYYYEHSKYTTDLQSLGFEQAKLKSEDGGAANYRVEIIEAGNTTFKARAKAVIDFDNDGTLNEWTIDENQTLKEEVPD